MAEHPAVLPSQGEDIEKIHGNLTGLGADEIRRIGQIYRRRIPPERIVTHELASIFAIGDNAVFLDAETRTMIALGDPKTLRHSGPEGVRNFLGRGKM